MKVISSGSNAASGNAPNLEANNSMVRTENETVRSERTKTCKVCGKTYTRFARLRIHERIHVIGQVIINNRQEKGHIAVLMKGAERPS